MSDLLNNELVRRATYSLVVLAVFSLLAAVSRLLLGPVLRKLTARTQTNVDDMIARALRRPIAWAILLVGIYLAVTQLGIWTDRQARIIDEVGAVAAVILIVYAVLRAFNSVAGWYTEEVAEKSSRPREIRAQALVGRKVVNILVLVVGIVMILTQLNVKIGPVLAGLGLGGLAVALALQDTLTNLFAGIYMMVDRPVTVGDFVKLESGEEGFVEEIGWRNTKVRMWANNLVIIPNSKLAQSVVTNYYLPHQEMSVYVGCGVAYDSDLEHVERVSIEVAKEVMGRIPGCATDWEPVVRYKEFADFSINFLVILRVKDFAAQYLLAHEYIKALHRRFDEEGIEIPFPIRTVIMRPARPAKPRQAMAAGAPAPAPREVGSGGDDGDAGHS